MTKSLGRSARDEAKRTQSAERSRLNYLATASTTRADDNQRETFLVPLLSRQTDLLGPAGKNGERELLRLIPAVDGVVMPARAFIIPAMLRLIRQCGRRGRENHTEREDPRCCNTKKLLGQQNLRRHVCVAAPIQFGFLTPLNNQARSAWQLRNELV